MTVSVFNNLGGQKRGDAGYTHGGTSYGFGTQDFKGTDASKRAKFQFDFEPPTHCLLENSVADIIEQETVNCTVFPISLDEDIRTVFPRMFVVQLVVCDCAINVVCSLSTVFFVALLFIKF